MKVYFVRHGQSQHNLEKRTSGWSNCSLSELGFQQAKNLAPSFEGIKIDKVYSSSTLRAFQTAQNVLPGYDIEKTDALREISVGDASGMFRTDVKAKWGENTYLQAVADHDYSCYGGETDDMIYERVSGFMKDLEKLEGCEKVAVFGHEGTVHSMMEYALGVRFSLTGLRIANCSVTVFSFENGKWKLERHGYVPELS